MSCNLSQLNTYTTIRLLNNRDNRKNKCKRLYIRKNLTLYPNVRLSVNLHQFFREQSRFQNSRRLHKHLNFAAPMLTAKQQLLWSTSWQLQQTAFRRRYFFLRTVVQHENLLNTLFISGCTRAGRLASAIKHMGFTHASLNNVSITDLKLNIVLENDANDDDSSAALDNLTFMLPTTELSYLLDAADSALFISTDLTNINSVWNQNSTEHVSNTGLIDNFGAFTKLQPMVPVASIPLHIRKKRKRVKQLSSYPAFQITTLLEQRADDMSQFNTPVLTMAVSDFSHTGLKASAPITSWESVLDQYILLCSTVVLPQHQQNYFRFLSLMQMRVAKHTALLTTQLMHVNLCHFFLNNEKPLGLFCANNEIAKLITTTPVYFQVKYYQLSRRVRKILKGTRRFKKMLHYTKPWLRAQLNLTKIHQSVRTEASSITAARYYSFFVSQAQLATNTPYKIIQQRQQSDILAAWALQAKKQ